MPSPSPQHWRPHHHTAARNFGQQLTALSAPSSMCQLASLDLLYKFSQATPELGPEGLAALLNYHAQMARSKRSVVLAYPALAQASPPLDLCKGTLVTAVGGDSPPQMATRFGTSLDIYFWFSGVGATWLPAAHPEAVAAARAVEVNEAQRKERMGLLEYRDALNANFRCSNDSLLEATTQLLTYTEFDSIPLPYLPVFYQMGVGGTNLLARALVYSEWVEKDEPRRRLQTVLNREGSRLHEMRKLLRTRLPKLPDLI